MEIASILMRSSGSSNVGRFQRLCAGGRTRTLAKGMHKSLTDADVKEKYKPMSLQNWLMRALCIVLLLVFANADKALPQPAQGAAPTHQGLTQISSSK